MPQCGPAEVRPQNNLASSTDGVCARVFLNRRVTPVGLACQFAGCWAWSWPACEAGWRRGGRRVTREATGRTERPRQRQKIIRRTDGRPSPGGSARDASRRAVAQCLRPSPPGDDGPSSHCSRFCPILPVNALMIGLVPLVIMAGTRWVESAYVHSLGKVISMPGVESDLWWLRHVVCHMPGGWDSRAALLALPPVRSSQVSGNGPRKTRLRPTCPQAEGFVPVRCSPRMPWLAPRPPTGLFRHCSMSTMCFPT